MAILEPIATKCRNPEVALNILKSCQIKCTDRPLPPRQVVTPSPPSPRVTPLFPSPQTAPEVIPFSQSGKLKKIGVFPLIYVDLCKDEYSEKVKAIISQNSICEELKKHNIKIQFDIIDDAEAAKFKTDYNFGSSPKSVGEID